ncbi:MAG: MarR family transcriptional regulator [Candidatus Aenigmarchaeota archaeon]|nr:MarR family transcriptional regulator [Candidatus Aenigmarchaeota archaeon]
MKIPIKKERIFRIISTENYLTVSKIAKKTGLAKSYVSKSVKDLKEKNVIWGGEKLYVNYSNLIREWGDFKRNIFNRIKPLAVDIFSQIR